MTDIRVPTIVDRPLQYSPRVTSELLDDLATRAVTSAPRELLEIDSPGTGGPLGSLPHCTPDDVAAAAATARAVQPAWAATPVRERAAVLLRFAELMLDRQDDVLDIIQLEN